MQTNKLQFFCHKFANLLGHTPSCFIRYTKMSFQLLSRYSVLRLRHEENSVKPRQQRSATFMKNSSLCRVDLIAARASERASIFNRIKLFLATLRTFKSFWVARLKNMFQTRFIRRKLSFELFDCVLHKEIIT